MRFWNDGIVAMAHANVARGILCAFPGIWNSSLTRERLAPNAACIFVRGMKLLDGTTRFAVLIPAVTKHVDHQFSATLSTLDLA
jgi:hypothetical protein